MNIINFDIEYIFFNFLKLIILFVCLFVCFVCNNWKGFEELQAHPFFHSIDWKRLHLRQLEPPDWVEEVLQVELRPLHPNLSSSNSSSNNSNRDYELVMEVVEAKELPGLKSNGATSDVYCVVDCEGSNFSSNIVYDTVAPKWDMVLTW